MPYTGSSTAGQVLSVQMNVKGEDVVTRKVKNVRNEFGKLGTMTHRATASGRHLGSVWKANATVGERLSRGIGGLAARFVGLQAALAFAQQKFRELVEWIKKGIEGFREFEVRMAEVGTILGGETYNQIHRLTIGVEHLAIQFGKSTSDMAKGLYDILSAAFDAKDAIRLLNTATKASIAGLSTVRENVDIFTTVLKSYGMTASQATKVSDTLFQSVIRGKFQFQDLASALQYIVPIAAQAGIQFDELMAALSTATRHGLRLDMTSRGLALAIQNIINPTKKSSDAAKKYGIDMSGLALRVMGLEGWFYKLNAATKEFGTNIISELIPNMRSLRVAMVLASDVGLDGFTTDLDLLTEAAGRTDQALTKVMATQQFEVDVLAQQLEYAERRIGEAWSGIDLEWKKIQAWWGTFFSGGDADAKVKKIDERFKKIRYSYYENIGKMLETEITPAAIEGAATYSTNLLAAMDTSELLSLQTQELNKYNKELDEVKEDLKYPWGQEIPEAAWEFAEGGEDAIRLTKITGQLNTAIENSDEAIEDYTEILNRNSWAYDLVTGTIDDNIQKLENYEITLRDIENAMDDLNDQLNKSIKYGTDDLILHEQIEGAYKGTLGYELALLESKKDLADITHDVSMGIKQAGYNYATTDTTLHAHIDTVRKYTKAQEESTNAIKLNNIEIMRIQLKGMMRRRGATRSEERRIKAIRIANIQERLAVEETADSNTKAYLESKEYIDDSISNAREQTYQLQYTYTQQVDDLRQHIEDQSTALDDLEGYWDTTLSNINILAGDHMATLKSIIGTPLANLLALTGYDVETFTKAMEEWLPQYSNREYGGEGGLKYPKEHVVTHSYIVNGDRRRVVSSSGASKTGWLDNEYLNNLQIGETIKWKRGTYHVPQTGPAILHKGETVSPAGRGASGGNTYNVSVNVPVKNISSEVDLNQLAGRIELAVKAGLMNADGTTNYRLR